VFVCSVCAEEVRLIDDEDGRRWTIDPARAFVNQHKVIVAPLRSYDLSDTDVPAWMWAGTDVASCARKSGPLYFGPDTGTVKDIRHGFWSEDGGRIYDTIGAALCVIYSVQQDASTPPRSAQGGRGSSSF
jgi:hypothetical protein